MRHVCAKYSYSCTAEMLNSLTIGLKSLVGIVNVFKLSTCVQGMFLTEVLSSDVLNTGVFNKVFLVLLLCRLRNSRWRLS